MPLGFFQFMNLLRQRVHFFVFAWTPLDELGTTGMEKMHLENIMIPLAGAPDLAVLKEAMRELKLEAAAPILLLDADGARTKELARALDDEGYFNVFFGLDGMTGFLAEKRSAGQ